MAVVTTSLGLKIRTCDLRFKGCNLVSPSRSSADVLRNDVSFCAVTFARRLQKNHFHVWLGLPDQALDFFVRLLNVVSHEIVSQVDVSVDQYLFRPEMHSQQFY